MAICIFRKADTKSGWYLRYRASLKGKSTTVTGSLHELQALKRQLELMQSDKEVLAAINAARGAPAPSQVGMHGDEMGEEDDEFDAEEVDRQEEAAAFAPFDPAVTGVDAPAGYEVLPCPVKLPHDIKQGATMALWFGTPYNEWYVGTVSEVNRRRTIQENVSVRFVDKTTNVETRGMLVAQAETYGAQRLWCLLAPKEQAASSSAPAGSSTPSLPPSLPMSPIT